MTCHQMFITRCPPKHSNTRDAVSLYWNVLDVVEAQAAWIADASGHEVGLRDFADAVIRHSHETAESKYLGLGASLIVKRGF
jgi:elongation factor P--beta-lysine ligase